MISHSYKPKILHICKVYIPIKGGIQKVVHSITNLLEKKSHRVLTTGVDGSIGEQTLDGTKVVRCRSYLEIASMPIAPSLIGKSRKMAKQADLVCLHYPFPLAELSAALIIWKVPTIVHWHSNVVAQKKLKYLAAPFTYITLLKSRAIVVTSERMIENSSFLKLFEKKIRVIPYGMSATNVQDRDSNSRNHFVLVGRHISYKGIDVAIHAAKMSGANLIIVGDGPLVEKHRLLVKELGLEKQIEFKTSSNDDEVESAIASSIGMIVSSVMENEAFALVQIEAMRMSKPIINTLLPSSVPWVARDGKEALTVKPNNVESLAKAIDTLQSNPQLAQLLGANGYQRYIEKFTDDIFANSLGKLYDEVLKEAR